MSSLSNIYIKTETLKQLAQTAEKKGMAGVGITISIDDQTNQYNQNVTAFVSQTKEEREAKKNRFYVGNGEVFWTDGNIVKAERKAVAQPAAEQDDDGLPF